MKKARYVLPEYYKILGVKEGATQEEIDEAKLARDKRIYADDTAFNEAYEVLSTEEGREWYRTRTEFQSQLKPLASEAEVIRKSEFVGKTIWAVLLVGMMYLLMMFIPKHFFFNSPMFYVIDIVVSTALACFVATKLMNVRDKHFEPQLAEIRQHNLAVDYENEKIYKERFGESFSVYKARAIVK